MKTLLTTFLVLAASCATSACAQTSDWQKDLKEHLPLLGHRNWIVVADSAYPSQTAPGIKTIYTGEKQLDTVRKVLAALKQAKHVRGSVFVDAELPHVPEKFANGIDSYRAGLKEALKGQQVTSLPHSEIIEKLARGEDPNEVTERPTLKGRTSEERAAERNRIFEQVRAQRARAERVTDDE